MIAIDRKGLNSAERRRRRSSKVWGTYEPLENSVEPLNGEGVPFIERRPNQCAWIINEDRVIVHKVQGIMTVDVLEQALNDRL